MCCVLPARRRPNLFVTVSIAPDWLCASFRRGLVQTRLMTTKTNSQGQTPTTMPSVPDCVTKGRLRGRDEAKEDGYVHCRRRSRYLIQLNSTHHTSLNRLYIRLYTFFSVVFLCRPMHSRFFDTAYCMLAVFVLSCCNHLSCCNNSHTPLHATPRPP